MNTSQDDDHVDYTIKDKQAWSIEEDLLICIFVEKYNVKKWNIIADELKSRIDGSQRIGKQCRERWHNHLDPMVLKNSWN
jgi:hypothetical protein